MATISLRADMCEKNPIVRQLVWPLVLLVSSFAPARGEIRPEFEFDHDPEIRIPATIKMFSDRQKPLWLQALARPEADLQRMAAEAIVRGHADGISGMEEAVPGLVAILTSSSSHPAARLAAAQALVKLDAKGSAAQMAGSAEKYGFDLRQIVEPALAAWDYQPARAAWQARLQEPGVRYRDLVLAIRCLATTGDKPTVANLLAIAHDRLRTPDVRAEAALTAGVLQDAGMEDDARRLIAGELPPLVDRLCAVRLLSRHTGDEAQRLLLQFAIDAEPAVAVVALTRLIDIDPHLALPLVEHALQSPDAKVRQRGVDACVLAPDPQRVAKLAGVLDDPHPGVRSSVRESLFKLARHDELDGPIRSAAMEMLGGERWRGLEQAALLLAALDHKPAAGRFVELLEFDRPEVGVAAAWGLKKLAISETLPAMLEKARRNAELSKRGAAPRGLDEQTAHLCEAFGMMKFAPAEPLLLQHVPKDFSLGPRARTAAVWSLGLLHEGVPDESLAKKLTERIEDYGPPPIPAELEPVKRASAVSIARMKATSQLGALRKIITPEVPCNPLGMTIRWAVIELTGEHIPEPPPPTTGNVTSFLQPLDN